jgi:ABC-type multidrug transport system fused ATPase/permease subunit
MVLDNASNAKLIEQASHERLLAQMGKYVSLWKMQAEQYGY